MRFKYIDWSPGFGPVYRDALNQFTRKPSDPESGSDRIGPGFGIGLATRPSCSRVEAVS